MAYPLDAVLRPEVQVNGQKIEAPRVAEDGSWKARLMQRGDSWSAVHSFDEGLLRKRPGLQGPIDDAFMDSFLCVRPTGNAPPAAIQRLTRFQADYAKWLRADLLVKDDEAVTPDDIRDKHLVLFGDPSSNRLIRRVAGRAAQTPRWDAASVVAVLYLGVVVTGLGYLVWNTALARVTAEFAEANIASDALSLARRFQAFCAGEVVSPASLDEMTDFEERPEFGLGVWDRSSEYGSGALGLVGEAREGYGTTATCFPDQGVVVVVLANAYDNNVDATAGNLLQAAST